MHLKKPCKICNLANTSLANKTFPTAAPLHNAHLRNMKDSYELWMYIPDIDTTEILVLLKSDTIEVFRKAVSPGKQDQLLLLLPIPININTHSIKVKRIEGGIYITMPKNKLVKQTIPIRLPIET